MLGSDDLPKKRSRDYQESRRTSKRLAQRKQETSDDEGYIAQVEYSLYGRTRRKPQTYREDALFKRSQTYRRSSRIKSKQYFDDMSDHDTPISPVKTRRTSRPVQVSDQEASEQHTSATEQDQEPSDIDSVSEEEQLTDSPVSDQQASSSEQELEDELGYSLRRRRRKPAQRHLRKKAPVNYKLQLKPQNFEQILEAEAEKSKIPNPRPRSSPIRTMSKLNEDEETSTPIPQGRIFALFGATVKGTTNPLNLSEILAAEESLLLRGVDDKTLELFKEKKLSLVKPVQTDPISFDHIAGHDQHIQSLKEMVGIPLMYPHIFEHFNITPPRGVLFYGPPGTGKTLMARALASSCSNSTRPVAFFLRKGADILSKWVGESEKQLRLLFEQAKAWQPSIIFFDELDGLAPVRSSKQDQIHASVVSTLLALMDGLDSRGQVVVIGATNRIDSIDPALRRPGRFDREFYFGLPNEDARCKIISKTVEKWSMGLEEQEIRELGKLTQGFNGADVKSCCTEAALHAVRRTFPQIYRDERYDVNPSLIKVSLADFLHVIKKIVPSPQRSDFTYAKHLPLHQRLLFEHTMDTLPTFLNDVIPITTETRFGACHDFLKRFDPRLLICGEPEMGQDLLGAHVMAILEENKFYTHTLDIALLSTLDSPFETIINAFKECKRHGNSVIYLPRMECWWESPLKDTLLTFIKQEPCFLVGTSFKPLQECPLELSELFSSTVPWKMVLTVGTPDASCRKRFFNVLLNDLKTPPLVDPPPLNCNISNKVVKHQLNSQELDLIDKEMNRNKLFLRQHLGGIVDDLKKSFRQFTKPIDGHDTDLLTIEDKIQTDKYETPDDFLMDIESMVTFATDNFDPNYIQQKELLFKVRKMRDAALEHVSNLPKDFVQSCWYFYVYSRAQKEAESCCSTPEPEPIEQVVDSPIQPTPHVNETKLEEFLNLVALQTGNFNVTQLQDIATSFASILFKRRQELDRDKVLDELKATFSVQLMQ